MGTVAPPFILCPLSESKELVGINPDREENRVIVTLGRNIAIRYHVLEQKQEASWTCSRHWLTSPVVFCEDFEKYGAVIDHNQIFLWEENDAHLASRKKYKFSEEIHSLRPTSQSGTLVIFKNGTVRSLTSAIAHRNSPGLKIIDEMVEDIDSAILNEKTNHVFLISRKKPKKKKISKCGVEKSESLKITTLKLPDSSKRDEEESVSLIEVISTVWVTPSTGEILGSSVVVSGNSTSFVFMCSDGYLYNKTLQTHPNLMTKVTKTNENGSKIAHFERYISNSTPAIISPLNSSTIVVYGCDPSEEGATVFLYDISHDLILSKQSLKLFGSPAIMFTVGNKVFVPVGLHILVLGLRLTKSRLSSLLGKHQIQGIDFFETRDPWTTKPWENDAVAELVEIKEDENSTIAIAYSGFEDLVDLVNTLESNGQPQSVICGQIIPKILERESSTGINWITEYFKDIPESFLIRILTFLISPMKKTVRMAVKVEPVENPDLDETNGTDSNEMEVSEFDANSEIIYIYPSSPLVDRLLIRPFDKKQMIQSLRSMDFEMVKQFLEYLLNRMESSCGFEFEKEDQNTTEISQLLKWTCAILDTHYPQFVFHGETTLVDSLLRLLNEKFEIMDDIEKLEPLLTLTMTKTSYEPGPSPRSKYRVETVVFE